MTDQPPISEIAAESSKKGKDPKTRTLLIAVVTLWLLTMGALLTVSWDAYFEERDKSQTLAQQISFACSTGDFGPGLSAEDVAALCSNAEKVMKDDPELQEQEIQSPEIQDQEFQDPEIQDKEIQEGEIQDPESQDAEQQDSEIQDAEEQESEVQDGEEQDPEIQDEEVQDPEVDDPDPASPYTFTFTFVVPGNGNQPGTTYTVTCNSGTGNCTVS